MPTIHVNFGWTVDADQVTSTHLIATSYQQVSAVERASDVALYVTDHPQEARATYAAAVPVLSVADQKYVYA